MVHLALTQPKRSKTFFACLLEAVSPLYSGNLPKLGIVRGSFGGSGVQRD